MIIKELTDWIVFDDRDEVRQWVCYASLPFGYLAGIAVMTIALCVLMPIAVCVGIIGASCSWLSHIGNPR